MVFQCFYVSATRLQFREVTKKDIALFGHDALEGAPVHEKTLCVTSGAPHFRTQFRLLTRCFKYAAFHLLSRTHVRRTTLCVTFGARRRSIPSGLLDLLFGHWDHRGRPSTPDGSVERPFGLPASRRDAIRTSFRHARNDIQTSGRVSSVGGSATHMKWPDGIGREAGIGRTRNREELTVFRACP